VDPETLAVAMNEEKYIVAERDLATRIAREHESGISITVLDKPA